TAPALRLSARSLAASTALRRIIETTGDGRTSTKPFNSSSVTRHPFMASRIVTIPNALTVIRMVLIPVFVSALYYQRFGWALAIFLIAGFTDTLDGLLARRFNQGSQLGQILDPIADKLLLVTSFITLSLPSIMEASALGPAHPRHLPVPFWVTAAVISRDIFIIVGSAAINIVTGFRGFRPSQLGKLNTVVQIGAIFLILVAARFPPMRGYLPTVYTIVFGFALISGVHYVFWASKLLNEDRVNREPGR
ncbi:MAG: CDP-alcohol phosphatidyltransferase family protein, partial [Pyrinomonadaceae bacterium]